MRDFTKLKSSVWHSERFRRLSDAGKVFYLYVLSSAHANSAGYYKLPVGWAMEDMDWTEKKVRDSLSEVAATGLVGYDEKEKIIFIDKHFEVNGPTNPKHAAKMLLDILSIPYTRFKWDVISGFSSYLDRQDWDLPDKSRDRLSREVATKTSTSTVTSTVTETVSETTSPRTSASPRGVSSVSAPELQMAVSLWNEIARKYSLPLCQKISDARSAKLKNRLKDVGGLPGWTAALEKFHGSKFLQGLSENGFRPDIDFLLQEKTFTRLIEGFYDERKTNHVRPLSRSEKLDLGAQRALDILNAQGDDEEASQLAIDGPRPAGV